MRFFAGNAPVGYRPKLVVNTLARTVLIGTGSSTLLRMAEETALRKTSLDEIVLKIPAALRRRAGQVAHDLTRLDQRWLTGQIMVAVGWSDQSARMLATSFAGSAFFEPILCGRLVMPQPADVPMPGSMPELIGYARQQVACLRDTYPEACGGSLQVAELVPDRIACWTVPDFDVGRSVSRPEDTQTAAAHAHETSPPP